MLIRKLVTNKIFSILYFITFFFIFIYTPYSNYSIADSRIKDIVYFEGVRDNMLAGYGLVVGLNGTGDNLTNTGFTESTLRSYLGRMGVKNNVYSTDNSTLKTKNVAAVMVTANLPPFARSGSRMSVSVSTLGDAKSLKGGVLLATQLVGADGEVYAIAQGQISLGEIEDQQQKKRNNKSIMTTGYITNGAIVENEIEFSLNNLSTLHLALKNPDITTARAIVNAINSSIRSDISKAEDPGTVVINIPPQYSNNVVGLLAEIETLMVSPDQVAKIVIDETNGTIVFSDNVTISNVAVSNNNLIVKVDKIDKFEWLMSNNKNDLPPRDSEPGTKMMMIKESTTLSDLVDGLNSLGVKTSDMIAILKSIQQVGALQATIEIK
ncbi:flagellar basal body P-ring protein FlgI [Lyticum sinuosum]|uniref:Flagellar P-ring protein n=1 Tax=Lyticum sinuosum TaxID=1332059 RepID=A0AAE4VKX6_9RICK|nr:flagellar basal body P-ring protein FlgI [Lyticum sinuosum]MDZ5761363.1 Flagellar basal body P-ring protein FlgI [Lyticum sinuosum]